MVSFYSIDKLGTESDDSNLTKRQRSKRVNRRRTTNIVNPELQETLWQLSHHLTEHHPGRLDLCIGMPVMIKVNEARECGVTNGAEGEIVGWTSRPISENQFALDTLFVKLTAAPMPIKLPGLPQNVIPLSHHSKNQFSKSFDEAERIALQLERRYTNQHNKNKDQSLLKVIILIPHGCSQAY